MSDNVKHPNHYCKGGIECIDAIKAVVSTITDPFEAYCTGNIIKYIWRWNDKNGIEDLHKAMQYIEFIEQYRATSHTTIASETSMRISQADLEELFAPTVSVLESVEPVKGKYEGLSEEQLHNQLCGSLNCFECPLGFTQELGSHGCNAFREEHPEEFRKIAIAHLEGLEGKA